MDKATVNTDVTYRKLMAPLLLIMQCFISAYSYECTKSCWHPEMTLHCRPHEPACLLRLPDNPRQFEPMPCQLDIRTNCTRACHVELEFVRFSKQPCGSDVLIYTDKCHHTKQCEYLVLEEMTDDGVVTSNRIIHGNMTSQTVAIASSRIRLNACYSADTFTSRSAHILIRAKEAFPKKRIDLGPTSVWVLSGLVLLFSCAILVVAKCKYLDRWLSPQPQPSLLPVPVPKA